MRSAWVLAFALVSCTRPRGTPRGTEPARSASAFSSAAALEGEPDAPSVLSAPVPPVAPGPWRDAVRDEDWSEARVRLEALPEVERNAPALRYVRARVAAQTHDAAGAVKLLSGLESELPALTRQILRARAEAALEVGPFEAAATYFAMQPGARAQLRAATAYQRAAKPAEAQRAFDAAVAQSKGPEEADARGARAAFDETTGARDIALADAKWITRNAPASAQASAALALLTRLEPGFTLTPAEHLARADKLADAGHAHEAEAELASGAVGSNKTPGELAHLRGHILYKLRRWHDAAEAFAQAAQAASPAPDEDAFYAARSLSREDKDDQALLGYRALAKKYARSSWADEALYLAARLELLLGRSTAAEAALNEYLKRFPRGKHASDASYDLALAALAQKKYGQARGLFATLAASEKSIEAARLHELEGVAALEEGDRASAENVFRDVIRTSPLSWPALAAAARLRAMSVMLPAPIEPADAAIPASPPLTVALPAPAELLARLGLFGEAEEALRTNEKLVQAASAPRSTEALCQAYASLDRAGRRFRLAQDGVRAETLMRAPSEASRWAWECLYPQPYADSVAAAEAREALPAGLVYAVMRQESAFQSDAASPVGARGLLQLMPTTAKAVAAKAHVPLVDEELTRPTTNITLGASYLATLLATWKGNVPLAVASYNAGPKAVSRWVERWGDQPIDVWAARIPYAETRGYVTRVMGNLARYAYLQGGEAAVPSVALALDPTLRAASDAY